MSLLLIPREEGGGLREVADVVAGHHADDAGSYQW
jgi:hypothetical protein